MDGIMDNGKKCKLQSTNEEKGIYIIDDLKPGLHCAKAASKIGKTYDLGKFLLRLTKKSPVNFGPLTAWYYM